jgi:hypothetical protein
MLRVGVRASLAAMFWLGRSLPERALDWNETARKRIAVAVAHRFSTIRNTNIILFCQWEDHRAQRTQ